MKEVFEAKETKMPDKGKSRSGKGKARDLGEDLAADDEDMDKDDKSNQGLEWKRVVVDKKTIDDLREEVSFVDSIVKDVLKSTGQGSVKKDWLVPWRRSKQLTHDDKKPIRIIEMLNFHTQEWANINPKSISRLRREVIEASITEYCAVAHYREALLDETFGGAAYVRGTLERVVSAFLKEGKGRPCHESEIIELNDGRRVSSRTLSWPDHIEFDSHIAIKTFDFSNHQARITRTQIMEEQTTSLQRAVLSIQKCELAWKAPHTDKKKAHPLQKEVEDALQKLVEVRPIFISIVM